MPEYGVDWPAVQDGYDSVVITVTAGYSDAPQQIKHAVMMIISTLFEQREDDAAVNLHSVPTSSKSLLDAYKVIRI